MGLEEDWRRAEVSCWSLLNSETRGGGDEEVLQLHKETQDLAKEFSPSFHCRLLRQDGGGDQGGAAAPGEVRGPHEIAWWAEFSPRTMCLTRVLEESQNDNQGASIFRSQGRQPP